MSLREARERAAESSRRGATKPQRPLWVLGALFVSLLVACYAIYWLLESMRL